MKNRVGKRRTSGDMPISIPPFGFASDRKTQISLVQTVGECRAQRTSGGSCPARFRYRFQCTQRCANTWRT